MMVSIIIYKIGTFLMFFFQTTRNKSVIFQNDQKNKTSCVTKIGNNFEKKWKRIVVGASTKNLMFLSFLDNLLQDTNIFFKKLLTIWAKMIIILSTKHAQFWFGHSSFLIPASWNKFSTNIHPWTHQNFRWSVTHQLNHAYPSCKPISWNKFCNKYSCKQDWL